MPENADNDLQSLLDSLTDAETNERVEAARRLGELETSSLEIISALEWTAARDSDQDVRQAALEVLESSPHRRLRRLRKPADRGSRRIVLREIEKWKTEGLIQPHLGRLLAGRYSVEAARRAVARPSAAPAERRSLGEVLLSEATIKVALFLGAFFVLAAAFILAALVEVARLPIMSITTIAFFIGAGVLYSRLRLPSFIMFTVGALLIAIVGGILLDQFGFEEQAVLISWAVITTVVAFVFAAGVGLYDSRLFSVLAYGFFVATVVLVASWLEAEPYVIYLLLALSAAAGVLAARWLDRSRGRPFFWPLFVVAQLLIAAALAASALTLLVEIIDGSPPDGSLWLAIAGLWLAGSVVYFASERIMRQLKPGGYQAARWLFAVLAVGSLAPAPLFFAGLFRPTEQQLMLLAWVWGLALAVTAEAIDHSSREAPRIYLPFLLLASASLFLLATAQQWIQEEVMAVILLSATAVVYLILTIRKLRWPLWSGFLIAAYLAYVAAFDLTGLESLEIFFGHVQLLPLLFFVGIALTMRRRSPANQALWAPPLVLACLVGAFTLLFSLGSGQPAEIALILLVYAACFAAYGWLAAFSRAIFGTTASLALALHFGLHQFDLELTAWPYVVLAWLYYLAGFALTWSSRYQNTDFGNVLRWSGLALAFFAAFLAPFEGEIASVIAVVFAAVLFTLEAVKQRNAWFGYPAALLYFLAYAVVLIELDVTEPQFYTVFAALLGLIMHYLMTRAGDQLPALLTGLTSQLILLGATYVQMLATERLTFFFVLFFQGLILLAYGIVIRSRSFVIGPICFAVLAVVSVSLSLLSGLPVAVVIGCTGLLLLLLGTAALWFRQRLSATAGDLGQRLSNWQW